MAVLRTVCVDIYIYIYIYIQRRSSAILCNDLKNYWASSDVLHALAPSAAHERAHKQAEYRKKTKLRRVCIDGYLR